MPPNLSTDRLSLLFDTIQALLERYLPRSFFSSRAYWRRRYRLGGSSGPGSSAHLSQFKAEVLNSFVAKHDVDLVIEFGCGDGRQLLLSEYPRYLGYDVSEMAVARCRELFAKDKTKEFFMLEQYDGRQGCVAVSLDVIFHLVEDEVFDAHMRHLFGASRKFVIVYSSNFEQEPSRLSPHVRHHQFSEWIARHAPDWTLLEKIPNRFLFDGDYMRTSFCDFYIFWRWRGMDSWEGE